MRFAAWGASCIGLAPLVWLALLRAAKVHRPPAYWWMGAAFAVSFVADLAGAFGYAPLASQVYPISQAALFAFVLLPSRPWVERVVALLLLSAVVSIMAREAVGLDVLLRVVAWGSVSGLAYTFLVRGHLRNALAVGFAAMTVAWCVYVMVPGWPSWLAFQSTRLVTAGWWGYAVLRAR